MTRLLAVGCLAIILVFCGMVAVHRGLASLYANPGKSNLEVWREEQRRVLHPDWKEIRGSLEQALSYDARNPDLLSDLGAAYEGEVAFYPVGDPAADGQRANARDNYLKALAGRPTWPHDWKALTLVKYRLGQTDAEFRQAMRNAVALGPWEPSVQYVISDIGMHHWEQFDEDTRRLVEDVMRAGMRDNPMDMVMLAHRYGMLDLVCNFGSTDEQAIKYCEQNLHR